MKGKISEYLDGCLILILFFCSFFFLHTVCLCTGYTAFSLCACWAQVLIQVPEKGSVITWDFDILKGDVTYTVFRCKRPVREDPVHQHHVSGATGGIGSVQFVNKNMAVGVDLSIVEPPHICRDGDSLQVRVCTVCQQEHGCGGGSQHHGTSSYMSG